MVPSSTFVMKLNPLNIGFELFSFLNVKNITNPCHFSFIFKTDFIFKCNLYVILLENAARPQLAAPSS